MTFEVSSILNYSVIPWNNPAKNPALNSCNGECWKIKGDVSFLVNKGTLIKRHKQLESVPFMRSNMHIERCCAGEPGSSLVTWNISKKAEMQSYVRLGKYAIGICMPEMKISQTNLTHGPHLEPQHNLFHSDILHHTLPVHLQHLLSTLQASYRYQFVIIYTLSCQETWGRGSEPCNVWQVWPRQCRTAFILCDSVWTEGLSKGFRSQNPSKAFIFF